MGKRNSAAWFSIAVPPPAVPNSYAIAAFSRRFGTQCKICHLKLMNPADFGQAFTDASPAGVPGTVVV